MESKHKRPKFSRVENCQYVGQLLGTRRCHFGGTWSSFALRTADLAENLFRSKYPQYVGEVHPEFDDRADVVWLTTLLSFAQQEGGATFDDINARTQEEIAGTLLYLNPDMRYPLDRRVECYCINLAQANNLTKIAALAKVISAIKTIGPEPITSVTPQSVLHEIAWLLKELYKFSEWSKETATQWYDCADYVNLWFHLGLLPRELPKPSCYFKLDDGFRLNRLKEFLE